MSIKWDVISGIGLKRTVTCRKTDGTAIVLTGAENFTCPYWSGETQAQLGTLTWAYNTPAAGTVDITISPAVAANAEGVYQWVLQLPDASAAYARGSFEIGAGPGSAAAITSVYCQYQDMLDHAPWIKYCATPDGDQTGYLDKRVMARNWMDLLIANSWRGTSQAYFGDAGRTAQFWLGGWVRRSPITSQWLLDYLQGTNVGGANTGLISALVKRPWVARVAAYRAIGYVGLAQIGINNQYAAYGQHFYEKAESDILNERAEIDLTGSGIAQFGIPLAATNTLFT
jgi:hypothetical protein